MPTTIAPGAAPGQPTLSSRLRRRPRDLWRAAMLVVALLSVAPAQAETCALVIGIDDHAHLPRLSGAVNDARDLAGALQAGDARVALLLDAQATRARILQSWSAITTAARPGDSVVPTHAGRGVQMPQALPGDEVDGMDEVFILAGFDTDGPGLGERIRDNDLAAMLARVPPGVPVLLVADSRHGGTMTRSVDARGKLCRNRYVALGPVSAADPLPSLDPATRSLAPSDFPDVVFVHAAHDEEQTTEVEIDGAWRGALSWSVARALEAHRPGRSADAPAEALAGFRDVVAEQVRALSGARQTPGIPYPRALGEHAARQRLAALLGEPAAADPSAPALVAPPPPRLFVRGASPAGAVPLAGVEIAATEETARLMWDKGAGELVDRATADVIAEVGDGAAVEQAVAAWRAVQALLRWAPQRPLELRLDPHDRRYRLGDSLWITATRPAEAFRYLMILNLASTGEVQLVFPSDAHLAHDLDEFAPGVSEWRLGPAPVTLPVGADHVLALASRTRLDDLRARIVRLEGRRGPEMLLQALQEHASDPGQVRVGVQPIFTSR